MIYAGYTPKKSSDEQYTPAYAVAPIIKYIPGNKIVWCPFDTEHSEYVLALKAAGIRVVHSHILTGEDFFVYEPEEWDLIVSNPPFSIKQKVVERCLALGKPFALLLSNLWLNRFTCSEKRRCRCCCSTNVSSLRKRTLPISDQVTFVGKSSQDRLCLRI